MNPGTDLSLFFGKAIFHKSTLDLVFNIVKSQSHEVPFCLYSLSVRIVCSGCNPGTDFTIIPYHKSRTAYCRKNNMPAPDVLLSQLRNNAYPDFRGLYKCSADTFFIS
jgi:hypothetical protein